MEENIALMMLTLARKGDVSFLSKIVKKEEPVVVIPSEPNHQNQIEYQETSVPAKK
ncbi:MAG: hypothetical protein KGI42_14560 [Xanthomonadaceae bacterium]|nr:hypothetical protein [Xanthomonadaceae bacterium]